MIDQTTIQLIKRYQSLLKGIGFICIYTAWILVFRLLALTLTTYLVFSSSVQQSKFEDINEILSSGELGIMALSSVIFICLIPLLNPITSTTFREIFTPERFERRYLFGFTQGSIFACGVILAFIMSGIYRYLGFFIHFEDSSFALGNVLLRALSLGVLIYCEEFLFRNKLIGYFRAGIEKTHFEDKTIAILTAGLTSLVYCGVKALQFDLSWMHLLTFFLISMSLSFRAFKIGDFTDGAGFWSAILIVFHPLLSLPILGNDFSGLILVKYQSITSEDPLHPLSDLLRIFSGGQGGPLSAFVLQLLFLLDATRSILRYKKVCQPHISHSPVL